MAGADGVDSADVLIVGGWPASEHIEPRSSSRVQVSYRSLVGNATVATDVVPALRDVPLIRAWAGMTTATGRWNRLGFIGEDRRLGPGKFFVVVAGGRGFTLGPVLGRVMSELVLDGQPHRFDLRPFSLERAVARMEGRAGCRTCAGILVSKPAGIMLEQLAQLAVNGLITGSILALTGVGASLVFGIQRVANLAHGDYLTVGAYVAFVVNVGLRQNLVVAAACGMVATAIFAVLAHYGLFRPLRGRGTIAVSLITVGLGLLIRDTIFLVAGSRVRLYAVSQSDVIQVGFLRLSPGQTAAIGVALVVAPATALFLARTRLGKAMRAVADDRDLAAIAGIDVEEGRLAGIGAALRLGRLSLAQAEARARRVRARLRRWPAEAAGAFAGYSAGPGLDELATPATVVCRCEGVTAAEISAAVMPGSLDPSGVRAETRAGMGECQARWCGRQIRLLAARANGVALRAVPELSVRPPIVPIPLGSLTGRPVDIDEETRARA